MTHVLHKTGLGCVGYLCLAVGGSQFIDHLLVTYPAASQAYYLTV